MAFLQATRIREYERLSVQHGACLAFYSDRSCFGFGKVQYFRENTTVLARHKPIEANGEVVRPDIVRDGCYGLEYLDQ